MVRLLVLSLVLGCGRTETLRVTMAGADDVDDQSDATGEPPPPEPTCSSCRGWVPMPSQVTLKAAGLYTHPNRRDLPEGALVTADNVIIRRDGVIETRRGNTIHSNIASMTADRIFAYRDGFVVHKSSDDTLHYNTGANSTFTAMTGTYAHPDATNGRMRTAQALQNLYITTSTGVFMMDSLTATPTRSGAPKAPGFERDQRQATVAAASLVRTGGSTVTATTSAAHGYRVNQYVKMNSAGEANFAAGTFQILTVGTTTTFTYSQAGANVSSGAQQTFIPAITVDASGFLSDGKQVAYRAVFSQPDANNAEKLGAVSPRIVVANSDGATRNAQVTVVVPSDATTSTRVMLYRSSQVATTVEPSDEMGLVWEALVTQGNVTDKVIDIRDLVTDELRGASLYASPSQEGIESSNDKPPLAEDIAFFKNAMYYGNTTQPHRYVITLLGTGSPDGLQNSDVVKIVGRTTDSYTANTSTPTTATQFKVDTGGTLKAIDIRTTALNLCAAINRNSSGSYNAYYLSGADDLPGKILIEERTLGAVSFYVSVENTTSTAGKRSAWVPVANAPAFVFSLARTSNVVTATISSGSHNYFVGEQVTITSPPSGFGAGPHTITATTATTFAYAETAANDTPAGTYTINTTKRSSSSNDSAPHRVYRSKTNQPEAVPLLDYDDLGSKDADLLRLMALRDSVFAFKEDGVFRGNGDVGGWQLLDPTVVLLAPDTAVALGNQIYAFTSQGVVRVSDTGVEIISRPIERTIWDLYAAYQSNVRQYSYAIGYESERMYELRLPNSATTKTEQGYIYNTMNDTWTRDTIVSRHGLINPADDKRYICAESDIQKERKAFDGTDYSDAQLTFNCTSMSGAVVNYNNATNGDPEVGDVIVQGANVARVIAATASTVTIASEDVAAVFVSGSVQVRQHIPITVQWAPVFAGNPGQLKLFRETNLLLGNGWTPESLVSHATELDRTFVDTTFNMITVAGQYSAAVTAWDEVERSFNLRALVPQKMRRGTQLDVKFQNKVANSHITIEGLSVVLEGGSERTSR